MYTRQSFFSAYFNISFLIYILYVKITFQASKQFHFSKIIKNKLNKRYEIRTRKLFEKFQTALYHLRNKTEEQDCFIVILSLEKKNYCVTCFLCKAVSLFAGIFFLFLRIAQNERDLEIKFPLRTDRK